MFGETFLYKVQLCAPFFGVFNSNVTCFTNTPPLEEVPGPRVARFTENPAQWLLKTRQKLAQSHFEGGYQIAFRG